MYHITGFDREEIIDLCIRINSAERGTGASNWPPCLGLFKSVVATLTYMRHNRTQAEIGESLGVSQPTISRSIAAVTPLIPEAVHEFVPTADDLNPDAQYILDGTCSRAGHGPGTRNCTREYPGCKRLAWRHGVSKNVLEKKLRVSEVANWVEFQVLPTRVKRGRG